MRFRVKVPQLQLVYNGTFQLTAQGEITTSLRYSARVECHNTRVQRWRHEAHKRMRHHVIDLLDRITHLSEQDPVVRKKRERLSATPPAATPPSERDRRDSTDEARELGCTDDHESTAPDVRARHEAPWLEAAQARLQARLRRLVEESDADERRTPAWATLDQLLRSLRYPFGEA